MSFKKSRKQKSDSSLYINGVRYDASVGILVKINDRKKSKSTPTFKKEKTDKVFNKIEQEYEEFKVKIVDC